MLMKHFLDERFEKRFLDIVASVAHEGWDSENEQQAVGADGSTTYDNAYYVNMMRAWYFATALAKQPDATLPYIEQYRLDQWTHNMAIQKAVESRRIDPELKAHLRGLRASSERRMR